ncbi:uncharacterized protein LOC110730796 [Chenopodium quinoa]|uniref:uncharacterized protein LOC110730796 n=1 Tax=Chenopodium quinoa TaxID=63459 RepID=UPI000B797987|nr:uncharacterized protein LOC110730796 [Chenopodium quinoa]
MAGNNETPMTRKVVNQSVEQPQIEIVDETYTLEDNQFHMPITPPEGGGEAEDPMAAFTPDELETTARVISAMSKKRKEAETTHAERGAAQAGSGTPHRNQEEQYNPLMNSPRRPRHESPVRTHTMSRRDEQSSSHTVSTRTQQQRSSHVDWQAVRTVVQLRASPFAQHILDQPMEKVKMPTCRYDGRGDLARFITSYEGHMMLYTNSDAVWCKVFPTTLIGAAADWFNNLEVGSVDSFERLTEMFVGQYVSNSVRQRTSGELMAVEQRLDESLRDYIRRLNNEANTIPKLQQEIAVMALMNGLVDSDFKRYLTRKNLPTLAAAFSKAHDYIKSEELMKTSSRHVAVGRGQNQHEGTSSGSNRPRALAPGRGGGSRQDPRASRPPMRYNTYTPLNSPRAAIYSVNQNREDWSRSIPMKARPRDVKKYCMFHRDVGHYTEECTQLKDNIEELIRKGHLTQYRLNTGRNQQPAQTVERQRIEARPERVQGGVVRQGDVGIPPLSTGRVDVITGGPVHGGTISGEKKHLAEHRHLVCALDVDNRPRPVAIPEVVFTEEDARGVVFPHDDPLVLITKINRADIKRVLVDRGSSANVLFVQAFNEMNIGRQYLKPVSYPVIGFNGSTVRPEGSIVLPVKLGDGPHARDVMGEFLVVDVKSAYNAIIGRPIIHDMQAIVSTYHLAIAYVSNSRVVEKVYGGQVMSKACYVTALKNPFGSASVPCNPIREGEPTVQDLTMKNFDTRPEEAPRSLPGGETVQIRVGQ